MRIKSVKFFFLGLSLLLLVVTVVHFFLFERASPATADQFYSQRVKDRITDRIQIADLELAGISTLIAGFSDRVNRENLPQTTYPYFIYNNENVVYWSENSFVPEFKQIKDFERVGVLTDDGSMYVVVRHLINFGNYACISLIPIYQSDGSGVKFDNRIFGVSPDKISSTATQEELEPIIVENGKVLFYLKAPNVQKILQPSLPKNTLLLSGVVFLLFGVFCFLQIGEYIEKHHFGRGFILVVFFLFLVRWILSANHITLLQVDSSIFEPMQLNANRWVISLGDRIINSIIFILSVGFLATYFYRSTAYYFILKSKNYVRSFYAVICVLLTFTVSYLISTELKSILFLSGGEYTYGLLTDPNKDNIVILLYYLLLSILFFLATHCCIYLFTKLFPNKVKAALHWLYGALLSLILLVIIDGFSWIYLLVGIYFIIVYQFQLARNFYVFRFKTSLYFFLAAFTFAVISTSVLHTYLEFEERKVVLKISRQLLSNGNAPFENEIIKKIEAIENDQNIKSDISTQVLARERVVEEVKRKYFKDFDNGYQSTINVFDSSGENLDILSDSSSIPVWKRRLNDHGSLIGKDSKLYKFTQPDGSTSYLAYTQIIDRNDQLLGSIIIELKPSGVTSGTNQIYGAGIRSFISDNKQYSFGLYTSEGKLIESNGTFVYPDVRPGDLLTVGNSLLDGIRANTYRHVEFKNKTNDQVLIISFLNKGWLTDWGNLSFLFLISVFAISGVLIMYSFYYVYKKRSQMNFTTRIQLSLNTAFLLPLLLVLVIAISVVGSTLRKNQELGFRESTSNLASTVQLLIADLFTGRMSEAYFQQEISNLADNAEVSLIIYNSEGKQQFVSQNASLNLPEYLNPVAFRKVIDNNERQVLLDESKFGNSHLASYVGIKPVENSEELVLGVPHIGSKLMLEKQLETVISSILNIFIVLFVILLLASFFVSRQLTTPIRTVTSHLRKTNLDKLDEPLPLTETNDEMGILVRAYNRMLKKLEESKIALSNSEKQTAWREMAKQVAHEIKNPLTPMKLSIQQLQRTLPADDPKSKQRIERALNSLNEQIDNISEIANSFSEFAKMPVPRSEEFDLIEIIQKTADLYVTNKVSDIKLNFMQPKLMVRGDRQLMSRVLTNLIINGLQSVPLDRRPRIDISAYKNEEDSFAIVEVKDNGAGVPDEISEKVFIPNFSTKVGGSGLGLALAKRGIEHGGGNIWFETEANVGTTFYVDLPLAR